MAYYENQSAMFSARAAKCKANGDMYYAKALASKLSGDVENYRLFMAHARSQYTMQKDNEKKAKAHINKTWR